MDIKTILEMDDGVKGLRLNNVRIGTIKEPVEHDGQYGKWHSQSFEIHDKSGKTWCQVSKFSIMQNMLDTEINLMGVSVNEYTGKDGKKHKNLRAESWETLYAESKQEPINKHDVEDREFEKGLLITPTKLGSKVWEDKDLRMARMNALSHAVEIVRMCDDGNEQKNIEQTTMQVQIEADKLVDYIYNGLNKDVDGVPF